MTEQTAEQAPRRKPGRPKGRPLAPEHRAAIKAAVADGSAARRGWETRRKRMETTEMTEMDPVEMGQTA